MSTRTSCIRTASARKRWCSPTSSAPTCRRSRCSRSTRAGCTTRRWRCSTGSSAAISAASRCSIRTRRQIEAVRARQRHQRFLSRPRRAPVLLPHPQGRALQARDRRPQGVGDGRASRAVGRTRARRGDRLGRALRPVESEPDARLDRKKTCGPTSRRATFRTTRCTTRVIRASVARRARVPIEPGADPRSGRWWWENPDSRECGLQPRRRVIPLKVEPRRAVAQ